MSGARRRTSSARVTSISFKPGTIQANPGVNTNALRPYLGFGTITLYETTGTSRYNSLQTQVERRSTRACRVQRRLHVLADEGRRQRAW